jgi:N-[(2S)-2-amino-2-carboxyethyl]-L-glutamate dehydrogenase
MSQPALPFSVLTGRVVHRLIHDDLAGCLEVVRAAYAAHEAGRTVNPASVFLRFEDRANARIIGLPAHVATPVPVSGMKWIASYPDNVRSGFPRASAVLLLNSHEHGYPFACMEASVISAARTAASAVLAAEALVGGRSVASIGIVGAGLIARYVHRFLIGTGWTADRIVVHDIDRAMAERFAERWCDRSRHDVAIAGDLGPAAACDLVLFATVAPRPHVHDAALFAHHPAILHLSLRDLAPAVILGAFNVVDDVDHVMAAQTSLHLAEQATGSRAFVGGTLTAVLDGRCRVDRSRPQIFSPFGLGVLDVALGRWVHDRAVAGGLAHPVDDFFFEIER